MTPFPNIPFTNGEATSAINEAAIGANKEARNPRSCFFTSCFTVSVIPSNNTLEFSSDYDFNNIIHIFFIRDE